MPVFVNVEGRFFDRAKNEQILERFKVNAEIVSMICDDDGDCRASAEGQCCIYLAGEGRHLHLPGTQDELASKFEGNIDERLTRARMQLAFKDNLISEFHDQVAKLEKTIDELKQIARAKTEAADTLYAIVNEAVLAVENVNFTDYQAVREVQRILKR